MIVDQQRGVNIQGILAQPNTEIQHPDNSNMAMSDDQDEEGEEEQSQLDDDSQADDLDNGKQVRKMLTNIHLPYKGPDEPLVFSYHYKYEKYLRDNNLIDPEKAKQLERKEKMKQIKKNEA